MRKTRRLHHKSATQVDDLMFKISKRKGSSLWQVRKRWPTDVAPILTGEFTRSTSESDRKLAEVKLPIISAEYVALVENARRRLADNPFHDLSELEIRRPSPPPKPPASSSAIRTARLRCFVPGAATLTLSKRCKPRPQFEPENTPRSSRTSKPAASHPRRDCPRTQ